MRVAQTIAELTEMRGAMREASGYPRRTIALVATMGGLHEGHRSLFRIARQRADIVVVSIFVNPLQFGPDEDYARYPRMLEDDLEACHHEGIDIVFVPPVTELYPAGRQVSVNAGPLGMILEGQSRPGHFNGVVTIVSKLFNIVQPDSAIFGQKDAQQLAVVRKMAADLNCAVEIVAAPVIRDEDGLALSTRNRFLLPHQRKTALALSAALRAAARQDNPVAALDAARSAVLPAESNGSFRLDYLTVVSPQTFAEVPQDHEGDALLVIAATIGETRLIDSIELTFDHTAGVEGRPGPDQADELVTGHSRAETVRA